VKSREERCVLKKKGIVSCERRVLGIGGEETFLRDGGYAVEKISPRQLANAPTVRSSGGSDTMGGRKKKGSEYIRFRGRNLAEEKEGNSEAVSRPRITNKEGTD